ncbi:MULTISPECIES: MFS transporter [Microbacterium]|uniref:MFS transporter n=1 Tax=Microbacterium TaxID=33882 RepID=UPI002780AD40|nr:MULTISPECIES: MFS transporter [Microbacterium]MDQ1085415.1 MFS family permease [Microbacterium sp. SORGH_AS_0344]MDQ1169279.1 MFS family permease [Microbacterium proteolyticum]
MSSTTRDTAAPVAAGASRVPLRFPTAGSTFVVGIAGYLGVNLSPYMIIAVQEGAGADVLTASWLVTGALLLTALTGLAVAPLCAGRLRRTVARVGLALAVLGFGLAALVPAALLPGLLLGGAGAGGAVAASGAALAAFRNPDRVAGFYGLANRGIITVVLAVVPLIGLAPLDVFGSMAVFSLVALALVIWLPAAPAAPAVPVPAVPETAPTAAPHVSRAAGRSSRTVTIAGFTLLVVFALWAASEDSLWAMVSVMGPDQAGVTPEGLGIALSAATAGGLIASVALMIVGNRLGRGIPLVVLLVLGGILKIVQGSVTDPTLFIVVFVVWNTAYALVFAFFVSTSAALDADGRWSGPLLATYLVGSALTPVIGAALVSGLGYQGFTVVLAIASFVLAVPAGIIGILSRRIERAATEALA